MVELRLQTRPPIPAKTLRLLANGDANWSHTKLLKNGRCKYTDVYFTNGSSSLVSLIEWVPIGNLWRVNTLTVSIKKL
jgi:hypothetical protein